MAPAEIVALAGAAALAGAMNAVAGGGTLVTFPTLLAFQTPPIVANATSTLALFLGTAGSVFGYRRHLDAVKLWLWRFVPTSILGGGLGTWLLIHTSERLFSRLVPFLILFATLLVLAQGLVKRMASSLAGPPRPGVVAGAIAFQFLIAVYGGYFGAGIGILMLAWLSLIGLKDIFEMNALKTLLASLINMVSSIGFIAAGLIRWPQAGVMTAGALVGYFVGAHYSQRIPALRVRQLVTFIGFGISAWAFYKEFLS
jgi:uncharacterized membrane protein YfcA